MPFVLTDHFVHVISEGKGKDSVEFEKYFFYSPQFVLLLVSKYTLLVKNCRRLILGYFFHISDKFRIIIWNILLKRS